MEDRRKHPRYSVRSNWDRRGYFDRRQHRGPLRWLWTPVEDLPRLIRQALA